MIGKAAVELNNIRLSENFKNWPLSDLLWHIQLFSTVDCSHKLAPGRSAAAVPFVMSFCPLATPIKVFSHRNIEWWLLLFKILTPPHSELISLCENYMHICNMGMRGCLHFHFIHNSKERKKKKACLSVVLPLCNKPKSKSESVSENKKENISNKCSIKTVSARTYSVCIYSVDV